MDHLVPFLIIAVALVVRLVLCAQLSNHVLLKPDLASQDDTAVYTRLAHRVAAGDLALGPDAYYVSPFYAYFLGLVLFVSGGSLTVARVVQALLGTGAVALIMQTSSAWFGKRAGLLAGGLAACTGLFAFNEILILQSAVDPFLTSLALFALTRAILSGGSVRWCALSGAAFAALALNRPNVLPFIAVPALAWLVIEHSRKWVYGTMAFIVAAVVVLAPVAVRNRLVAGEWVLISSHGGLNFYIGNGEGADGMWRPVPGVRASIQGQAEDARAVASVALKRPLSSGETSNYYYGLAWSWIRSHPFDWARLLSYKLGLAFNARDDALNYSYAFFAHDEPTILPLLFVGPFLIIPLGLFGLWVGRPLQIPAVRRGYRVWVAFLAVYALTLVAFFVTSRYRLPLLVALLVGAGAGGVSLLGSVLSRPVPWRRAGLLVAVCGVAAFPLNVNDGRISERGEYLVALVREGRFDDADRILKDTVKVVPKPGVLLLRVASMYRDKGDNERALICLELADGLDRNNGSIELALGEALLQAGRSAEAMTHLKGARNTGRAPFTATYAIAQALASLGRIEEARNEVSHVGVSSDILTPGLTAFGDLAMQLEDAGTAERFYREVVTREPRDWKSHHALGVAYGAQQKIEPALKELEAARLLAPTNATVRFQIGLVLARAGRISEARGELAEALRLRPDYTEAREVLAQLGAGR